MSHGVSRLPFTSKARVRSHSSPYEICDGKVALGQTCVQVLRRSAVSIIPSTHLTHLPLHVAPTRTTNGRSLWTFHIISALWETGEHWMKKYRHISSVL